LTPQYVAIQSIQILLDYADQELQHNLSNPVSSDPTTSQGFTLNVAATSKYFPGITYDGYLSLHESEFYEKDAKRYGYQPGPNLQDHTLESSDPLDELLQHSVEVSPISLANRAARIKLVDFKDGLGKVQVSIPPNYKKCIADNGNNAGYLVAMQDHINMMVELECLSPPQIHLPNHISKALTSGWVFDCKTSLLDEFLKYKARCVLKGSGQRPGVDFGNTYSPTVYFETVRIIITLAIGFKWVMLKFDVVNAFRMAVLDKELWVIYPEGMPGYNPEVKQYSKLLRNWEGTKQGARMWWLKIGPILQELGYIMTASDKGCWVKINKITGLRTLLALHVDDGIGATEDPNEPALLMSHLQTYFKITSAEKYDRLLGMYAHINADGSCILMNDSYFPEVAYELGLDITTLPARNTPGLPKVLFLPNTAGKAPDQVTKFYQKLIGSLIWPARTYRPEISSRVRQLGQFNANPSFEHVEAAIWVLCYCITTAKWGLKFVPRVPYLIPGQRYNFMMHVDSDWSKEWCMHSVGGMVCQLVSEQEMITQAETGFKPLHNVIGYHSKKQIDQIANSTAAAESIAIVPAANTLYWGRGLLFEAKLLYEVPSLLFCDNTAAIVNTMESRNHPQMRHLARQLRTNELRVEDGTLVMRFVKTFDNISDQMTKQLDKINTERQRDSIMGEADFGRVQKAIEAKQSVSEML
jgi:Reverse transcriptase (RNA-dependent DNA polymerase)